MSGALQDAWAKLRYRRLLARMAGPKLLQAFADTVADPFFVEIGANDGERFDHLHPFIAARGWRGIMVEPVPYVFARLQANYAGRPQITCENAAIADRDGELPFYHLREATADERRRLPEWYDALGSFSREAITSHAPAIPDVEARIAEIRVPALTFASLRRRHGVERVDLVLIDTEGYDFEVVRSMDLDAAPPRLLVYEHFHLGPGDRAACREHLHAHGYETMEEGFDTFCLQTGVEDRLTARWRRLEPAVAPVSKHEGA